jgi:6-phosphofructo-2-kinase/fructose-2,6-biphosphatase 2
MAYGCHEERYALPIQAVDTHRPKPKAAKPDHSGVPEESTVVNNVVKTTSEAPARDYFGDIGKVAQSAVQAVSNALQRDQEVGDLTPKAVASSINDHA